MEKSRTIHIINLGHYLENTPFAQDLLKHNMEMSLIWNGKSGLKKIQKFKKE